MVKDTSRAWFLVPALGLLLIGFTLLSLKTGRGMPETFAGRDSARVELRVPQGQETAAARGLMGRFSALGVHGQVERAEGGRIVMTLRRVSNVDEALAAAFTKDPLVVRPIYDARDYLAPDAPERNVQVAPGAENLPIPWATAPTRTELEKLVQQRGLPAGLEHAVECAPAPDAEGPGLCAAWLIGPERITGADIQDAQLRADRVTEEPLVTLEVADGGAAALERLTTANQGRQLAIIALGEVRARPLVTVPARGPAWTFSTRTGDTNRRQAVERADQIVATVELEPLPPVQVEKVEPLR